MFTTSAIRRALFQVAVLGVTAALGPLAGPAVADPAPAGSSAAVVPSSQEPLPALTGLTAEVTASGSYPEEWMLFWDEAEADHYVVDIAEDGRRGRVDLSPATVSGARLPLEGRVSSGMTYLATVTGYDASGTAVTAAATTEFTVGSGPVVTALTGALTFTDDADGDLHYGYVTIPLDAAAVSYTYSLWDGASWYDQDGDAGPLAGRTATLSLRLEDDRTYRLIVVPVGRDRYGVHKMWGSSSEITFTTGVGNQSVRPLEVSQVIDDDLVARATVRWRSSDGTSSWNVTVATGGRVLRTLTQTTLGFLSLTDLRGGADYTITVTGVRDDGSLSRPRELTFTAIHGERVTNRMVRPAHLETSSQLDAVSLRWFGTGAPYYRVSVSRGQYKRPIRTVTLPGEQLQYTFSGLQHGTGYWVSVQGWDGQDDLSAPLGLRHATRKTEDTSPPQGSWRLSVRQVRAGSGLAVRQLSLDDDRDWGWLLTQDVRWGDGERTRADGLVTSVGHVYTEPGRYPVTVRVTDSRGNARTVKLGKVRVTA